MNASSVRPDTLFPLPRRLKAHWITCRAPARDVNVYALFRKEFTLAAPAGCALHISADRRYRLYVNDMLVGDGPPSSQPWGMYYDTWDLSGRLTAGANCLALIVHHHGKREASDASLSRLGLIAELVDGSGATLVATGADWRCCDGVAWQVTDGSAPWYDGGNKAFAYQEHCDHRLLPAGWNATGFDDSAWAPAQVITTRPNHGADRPMPWVLLTPRDIPLLEETALPPKAVVRVEEALHLEARRRRGDVSIPLSQGGRPLQLAVAKDVEKLMGDGAAVLMPSTVHREGYDGVYDPVVLLDFGRVATAYVELDIEGPAGATIELGMVERLVDGRFNNTFECCFAARHVLPGRRATIRTFAWYGHRYLQLRVSKAEAPVTIHRVRQIRTRMPLADRGLFRSEDRRLEQVHDICRETLRLCAVDSLMDTPWREQAQWLGDVAAVTAPGLYACFGDTLLPGKFIRQSAAAGLGNGLLASTTSLPPGPGSALGTIPDYSLWWIIGLLDHARYTGDGRWVERFFPEAARIVRHVLEFRNADGFIEDMGYWVFVDWAAVDVRGECAAFNAILAGALDAFAEMARQVGAASWRATARAAAAAIRDGFHARFFDAARGCYADGVVIGELSPKTSEHANAAALAFGCCDARAAQAVIRRVFEAPGGRRPTEAQPFFMVVVLEALARHGRMDLALDLIRRRWGRMLDAGATSCFEEWYHNGSWRSGEFAGFLRSESHAWSACAAAFLIRRLAGFEILEPGCARVRLAPHRAPFAYEVRIPTPRGDIGVAWNGKQATINAPRGISVAKE